MMVFSIDAKESIKLKSEGDLVRGDVVILKQIKTNKIDLYDIISSYLQAIESNIAIFYRNLRQGRYDGGLLFNLFKACDILGTSDMFHEILDLHGLSRSSRDHFTRSLCKVGQYAHGTVKLYRSLRDCKHGVIKDIVVTPIPSSSSSLSHCHPE
jgi:predicted RNA-binding protein